MVAFAKEPIDRLDMVAALAVATHLLRQEPFAAAFSARARAMKTFTREDGHRVVNRIVRSLYDAMRSAQRQEADIGNGNTAVWIEPSVSDILGWIHAAFDAEP